METRREVSAGGVTFRARADDGFEVAVIRTHEGRWQLPKGWVEAGESAEGAARREVREETGLDTDVIGPLDRIEYWYVSRYEDPPARVHKFVHMYLLRCVGGSTDDHDDEVTEARWVEIGEAERTLDFAEERRMVALARDALARASAPPG
ncbi:MAG TPA: NUDIX domain-containing protein [Dehalococcoidia bacterium]|nr:NUDIX domain-containing protein [Dehalococcoidia bacterium]